MSLPGLDLTSFASLTNPSVSGQQSTEPQPTRTIDLAAGSEWRFELGSTPSSTITVEVLTATKPADTANDLSSLTTAEIFGAELAPNHTYTLPPLSRAAISTHTGCTLRVTGTPESEYTADETQLTEFANVHFALENLRSAASSSSTPNHLGPRVLLVGPPNVGKTSLAKQLASYAQRCGRSPLVVNLDAGEGLLCPAGSFSAVVLGSGAVLDPEAVGVGAWGQAGVAGPSADAIRMPLAYHFGHAGVDDASLPLFRSVTTRVALAATARLEADPAVASAGMIVDLGGSGGAAGPAGAGSSKVFAAAVEHIVGEFSINVLLVLGSERMYSDLARRFGGPPAQGDEQVSVLKLPKNGGAVDRDAAYMRMIVAAQVKQYFFGDAKTTLSPQSQQLDFDVLKVLRMDDGSSSNSTDSFLPGGADDFLSATSAKGKPIYTIAPPVMGMEGALLAVKHAAATDPHESIRDSSVLGYLYVSEVDETKKKVKLLCPVAGRIPLGRAIVWGVFPEVASESFSG